MSLKIAVNLLFLTPGRVSGMATYVWSLLDALRQRPGIALVLYVQNGWTPWATAPDNVEIVACPQFRSRLTRVWWEQMRLTRDAARRGAAVVFSPGYVAPLSQRLPQVVMVPDMYYAKCPQILPRGQLLYWSFFIPRSVAHARKVIAMSETTQRDIEDVLPASRGKTVTVLAAAPPSAGDAAAADPQQPPYAFTVAFMTPNKNPDALVLASIALRAAQPQARLVVAGADPQELLAEAIARHQPGDAVQVLGEVDDAALQDQLRAASVFVIASTYEGFGLPPLQAQAAGVPVVSSRGGSLPEVLGDGALYADPADPQAFAAAIARVIADPVLRAQLVAAGRQNAERFSWARAAAETEAVLRAAAA